MIKYLINFDNPHTTSGVLRNYCQVSRTSISSRALGINLTKFLEYALCPTSLSRRAMIGFAAAETLKLNMPFAGDAVTVTSGIRGSSALGPTKKGRGTEVRSHLVGQTFQLQLRIKLICDSISSKLLKKLRNIDTERSRQSLKLAPTTSHSAAVQSLFEQLPKPTFNVEQDQTRFDRYDFAKMRDRVGCENDFSPTFRPFIKGNDCISDDGQYGTNFEFVGKSLERYVMTIYGQMVQRCTSFKNSLHSPVLSSGVCGRQKFTTVKSENFCLCERAGFIRSRLTS